MVLKGYWTVLPFSAVRHFKRLKLSPAGVVPQCLRRPRPIMDYTFTAVNQHSSSLSPSHSMQIGSTMQRILQHLAYANPAYGPPLMLKLDLSDGYYRVRLSPEAALELAIIIPGVPPHRHLVALPLSLPMGWSHSPPYFCAFTESIVDVANLTLRTGLPLPPHPLEATSQCHDVPHHTLFSPSVGHPPTPSTSLLPLNVADVYIDDFIGLAQGPTSKRTLRAILHAIDSVFRTTSHPADSPNRKQIISESKLATGDGAWSTQKTLLGWFIDSAAGTLSLPAHKVDRLSALLHHFSSLQRTSRKKWQQLLGELRHMATAIKGATYLFSILQHVLTDQQRSLRLRLRPLTKAALADWRTLADSLATCPVPISSLVPTAPHYISAVDASGFGIGGYWLPTSLGNLQAPIIFRAPLPPDLAARLVSAANPTGDLTNSHFELAALVTGSAVLAQHITTPHASIWYSSDNTPAVHWCQKGSTSSTGPTAHLLWWMAQLARDALLSLHPMYVPGTSNTVADFCSRSFSLLDQEFLQAMNATFPITPSWKLVHLTPEMSSWLTSTLSSKMCPLVSPPSVHQPLTQLGRHGKPSALTSTLTQPCKQHPTPSSHFNCSPFAIIGEKYLPVNLRFAAKQWEMPFAPLGRR
jgi:hypothetical protein